MRQKGIFRFKQFSVCHDRCTMKVGTDGVLLAAWVNTLNARNVLDIGTGCGVIALMIAQRTDQHTFIDAVELLQPDASQAEENVRNSPWIERIRVFNTPVQEFDSRKQYDLIISNPPYFINSLRPPERERYHVRHTITLTHHDLLFAVKRLLSIDGKFNVILPFTEGLQFITLASSAGLTCSRQWAFKSRKEKPVERWLLEFTYGACETEQGEIVLYKNGDTWSDEYVALTRAYYLNIE